MWISDLNLFVRDKMLVIDALVRVCTYWRFIDVIGVISTSSGACWTKWGEFRIGVIRVGTKGNSAG